MSEIAKCPVCGMKMDMDCVEDITGVEEATYDCIPCGITITGTERFEKISAAMEHKRKWDSDSSLETWFPYTREELDRLTADKECHSALREAVKKLRHANNKDRWDYFEWAEACAEVDRLLAEATK